MGPIMKLPLQRSNRRMIPITPAQFRRPLRRFRCPVAHALMRLLSGGSLPPEILRYCFGNRIGKATSAVNMHRALWPHSGTMATSCFAPNFSLTSLPKAWPRAERYALGRRLREQIPLRMLGEWRPPADRPDVV